MLELYNRGLDVIQIQSSWYKEIKNKNLGAFVSFIGIVRDENGIDGLSFDIYRPMLEKWFELWQKQLKKKNALLFMAHSLGDVLVHESSFMCAIVSPQRKIGLKMLECFVEDFKANAPIWKYDLKNKQRLYAKDRSKALPNSGLLKG